MKSHYQRDPTGRYADLLGHLGVAVPSLTKCTDFAHEIHAAVLRAGDVLDQAANETLLFR